MFVAGGTDLYPNMKRRQQTPKMVIGLAQLEQLRTPRASRRGDGPGAGLTLTEVCRRSSSSTHQAVAKAAELISTPLLRNMGTHRGKPSARHPLQLLRPELRMAQGESLLHEEGWRDLLGGALQPALLGSAVERSVPVMVAIGAKVKLISSSGERLLPAAELYSRRRNQAPNRRPDELLTEIHLPPTNGWRATYWKLRRRGSFDFPVLGVATCLRLAGDGTVEHAKIILGGVGSHPIEAVLSEKLIVGKKLTEERFRRRRRGLPPSEASR